MREVDRVKDGVWETRRCRERVGRVEGTKEENINMQIVSVIIKQDQTNNYGKMQKTVNVVKNKPQKRQTNKNNKKRTCNIMQQPPE